MAYNDKNMVNDYSGHKVPQYYNPVTDKYEPLHGADGVSFVGNHVLSPGGVWIPQTGNDDGSINTRVTGSNVEIKRITKTVTANEKEEVGFVELKGYSKYYVESYHTNLHTKDYELTFRKRTSFGQLLPPEVGEFTVIEQGFYRARISEIFNVDATRYDIYIDNISDENLNFTISVMGII